MIIFCRARCPACGQDFLVALSCTRKGGCPARNARRTAETAAHVVDQVFPPLQVRQWVLSVPKRLRYFLSGEPEAGIAVLHCFLRVVEAPLHRSNRSASARARFGTALNRHLHGHCCILDGVFEPLARGGAQLRQAATLMPDVVTSIIEQVCGRVERWFACRGLLDPDDARGTRGQGQRRIFRSFGRPLNVPWPSRTEPGSGIAPGRSATVDGALGLGTRRGTVTCHPD
jgi:hypothetical protein